MTTPLLVVLPYNTKDAVATKRLLGWILEIRRFLNPAILLVADAAVPHQEKVEINTLAKEVFNHVETMVVSAPLAKDGEYHIPAAFMFEQAARQVHQCYKWNWLWLEPDCVPLKSEWLWFLTEAYHEQPKRFMGSLITTDQPDVPRVHMAGVGIYPNNAHQELKQFCDGTKGHFDMQMAGHVVPRAVDSPLLFHRWGAPNDPPTFKAEKLPTDGPNVGTLDVIPPDAVLMHRNKDGTLIELLRQRAGLSLPTCEDTHQSDEATGTPVTCEMSSPKRRGRPRKVEPEPVPIL